MKYTCIRTIATLKCTYKLGDEITHEEFMSLSGYERSCFKLVMLELKPIPYS